MSSGSSVHAARTSSAAGPGAHFTNGAAAGRSAIGEAAEWIRREDCSVAVAGGADAPITREIIARYDKLGVLTHANDDAGAAVRPYEGKPIKNVADLSLRFDSVPLATSGGVPRTEHELLGRAGRGATRSGGKP